MGAKANETIANAKQQTGQIVQQAKDNPGEAALAAAALYFGGPVSAAGGGMGALGLGGLGAAGGVASSKEQDDRLDKFFDKAAKAQSSVTESVDKTVDSSGTSQTIFDPRGDLEQRLLDESVGAFGQQKDLVNQLSGQIAGREGLQTQARESLGGILGGGAFDLTGSEQARIDAFRDASLAQGESRINDLLDERLSALNADAARRGIRGQAFTQLQGQALGAAAKSLTDQQIAANQVAAQQAIDLPGQRVGIQQGTAAPLASFQDALAQQSIQNQNLLQNPAALQMLLDERLKGGKQIQTGSQNTTGGSTQTTTGIGQAELLSQMGQNPGATASGIAGGLEAIGAAGKAAGSIFGSIG